MIVADSDLRALAVFRSVVEHRGFLGAQVALGLSQSAVSFHIKALEERLGFTLCRRGRGGFELTDRGALVFERSTNLFRALSDFEAEVGALRNRVGGALRLGLVDNTITDEELPIHRVIAALVRKAPDVVVHLAIDTPEGLLSAMGSGGSVDIAILPETQAYPGLRFTPLKTETHLIYCAWGHPLFAMPDAAATAEALLAHPFVARAYANLRELNELQGAQVRSRVSNMEAQAMMILSGAFLGFLPEHFARRWVKAGVMRALAPGRWKVNSQFVLASRVGGRQPAAVGLFIEELVALASERAHALEV